MTGLLPSQPKISDAAMALLQELSIIPQVVGYDHRIAALDDAGLIEWKSGEGYFISEVGRAVLQPKGAAV
jgi:hypothetical protein